MTEWRLTIGWTLAMVPRAALAALDSLLTNPHPVPAHRTHAQLLVGHLGSGTHCKETKKNMGYIMMVSKWL